MTTDTNLTAISSQLAHLGEELDVPFLKLLGVRILKAEMGRGEILLALRPEHQNTWNVAHGGVLLTLMDVAMAVAARSADPGDRSVVTIELKNNFYKLLKGYCGLRLRPFILLLRWRFVRLSYTMIKGLFAAWPQVPLSF